MISLIRSFLLSKCMEYNVYKLGTKPFDKRTFKEFRILAEDKQLKSFCYNRYNYFRVDDRVSKKPIVTGKQIGRASCRERV